MMDPKKLAQEIIDGRRLTREDDLKAFLTCDLQALCEGADKIREHFAVRALICVRLSMAAADAVLRTASSAPNLRITIRTARCTAFCRRRRLWTWRV